MEQQGEENSEKAKNVLELHGRMKEEIVSITRSQYAIRIIDYLFSFPVFQSAHFQQETAIAKASAMAALIPVLTLLFAFLILGEVPDYKQRFGIFPVLIGSFLITRSREGTEVSISN